MTRDDIRNMSDIELSSAIFDAIGRFDALPRLCYTLDLATSLNTIQEAEATLTPEQWVKYLQILDEMPHDDGKDPGIYAYEYEDDWNDELSAMWFALTLCPRQRVEALLETLLEANT